MTTITTAEPIRERTSERVRPRTRRFDGLRRRWATLRAMFVWDTTAARDWQEGIHRRDRWS